MIDAEWAGHVELIGAFNRPVTFTTALNFSSASIIPPGWMFIKIAMAGFVDEHHGGLVGSTENPFVNIGITEVTSGGIVLRRQFNWNGFGNTYVWFPDRVSRAVISGVAKNARGILVFSSQHWV